MSEVKNVIFNVNTFSDRRGFEVRELSPKLTESSEGIWITNVEGIDNVYFGMAHLMIPTGNPEQPTAPYAVQINFPKTIKTVEQAFNTMEDEINKKLQKDVEEQKALAEKKKQAKSKELILPGNNNPMIIPFPTKQK